MRKLLTLTVLCLVLVASAPSRSVKAGFAECLNAKVIAYEKRMEANRICNEEGTGSSACAEARQAALDAEYESQTICSTTSN